MIEKGMTVRAAARRWVSEFNALPQGMISKLMQNDPDEWNEVTTPKSGDRVYVYDVSEEFDKPEHNGEIMGYDEESELYCIELDNGKLISVAAEDFEVLYDDTLPMWGMMWSFGDSADDYWLEEMGGIRIMSECGFRIYWNEEFGYFFGIDGCGYDFYEAHWLPLYKARGLQWHDPKTEKGGEAA